jgi:AcrR family transcriptional regulator/DNA-binding MarR family transcriptional regulator
MRSRGPVSMRRGGVQVSELQRARMLSSAVQVVSEYGYERMSVARVTGRARVSRRTFYDMFEDREDCFLAVFEDTLARAQALIVDAYQSERGSWREKVRGALGALLVFFDGEPQVRSLLVVDALMAGPRVLERRARVLEQLARVIDEGGSRAGGGRAIPPLTGEGVLGAVFGVIHTRISQPDPGRLIELLNPLMGMIVLPYQGQAVARRELERPLPPLAATSRSKTQGIDAPPGLAADPLSGLGMRITYRTLRVLSAIGQRSGASNREVADLAGVSDQGQMSKLLTRLERLGLIENTSGHDHQPTGEPNAWTLTPRGGEIERAIRARTGDRRLDTNGVLEEHH